MMEMAKRDVPGVWTYGFYDGWVPNYLFWIAVTHNSFGRFYEVQSYGPDVNKNLRLPATTTSREWYRPNPPLPSIAWGPRNNVNIQESALLIALNQVAKSKELYLDNYWLKNKRAVEKGANGPVYGWVIPAAQRRRVEAAAMVNALRHQGLEVHQATAPFKAWRVRGSARRLRHSRRSTLSHSRRHVLLGAELSQSLIRAPTTTPAGPCSICAT